MFCLEIYFRDGISFSEAVLLTRLSNLIGKSKGAHLEIEGAKSDTPDLRVVRGLARDFEANFERQNTENRAQEQKTYSANAKFELDSFKLQLTALDSDLLMLPEEAVEQAARRILKAALNTPVPQYPALVFVSEALGICSLAEEQEYLLGRSRKSSIRVDDQTVSECHAKFYLLNKEVWLEDLSSKNGTFVNGVKIDYPLKISAEDSILFGTKTKARIIYSESELNILKSQNGGLENSQISNDNPSVLSHSILVNPQCFEIVGRKTLRIGRDPTSEIWVGGAHISRVHAEVRYADSQFLEVRDLSKNGCTLNGSKMPRDIWLEVKKSAELDLGEGVLLYICQDKLNKEMILSKLKAENKEPTDLTLLNKNKDLSNLATTFTHLSSQHGIRKIRDHNRARTTFISVLDSGVEPKRDRKNFFYAVLSMIFLACSLILVLQLVIFN